MLARASALPYPDAPLNRAKYKSTEQRSAQSGYTLGDSLRYWKLVKQIQQFTDEYADGSLDQAARLLESLE